MTGARKSWAALQEVSGLNSCRVIVRMQCDKDGRAREVMVSDGKPSGLLFSTKWLNQERVHSECRDLLECTTSERSCCAFHVEKFFFCCHRPCSEKIRYSTSAWHVALPLNVPR